jgi:hypothetical protein
MQLRRALRLPVRTAAKLGLKFGEVPVRIVDISTGGARLTISPSITQIAIGDRLSIEVAGTVIPAEVRWRLGHQAGVQFEVQLTEPALSRILKGPAPAAQATRHPPRRRPAVPAPTV